MSKRSLRVTLESCSDHGSLVFKNDVSETLMMRLKVYYWRTVPVQPEWIVSGFRGLKFGT